MKTYFVVLLAMIGICGAVQAQNLEAGLQQMTNENYREARKIFKDLIAKSPKDPEPYYYLGDTYFQYDNLDSARFYFAKGAEIAPRDGINYVGLGKIEWANNKKKEARDNFDRAERLGKGKDWRILYEIGKSYLEAEEKQLDLAIEKLEAAKDLARTNPNVFSLLGDAYLEKNEGGKAANQYSYVIERLNIESPEIYRKRAILFRRSRTYSEAEANLEKAIALDPSYAPAYRDLIEVYQLQQKYAKVTPLLKKYTELVGDDQEARSRYVGFLFRQAKDYDNTIVEADKVLAKDPANYNMYRWKGYAQVEKGQNEEAVATLDKFFQLVGDNKTYFTDYDYYARAAAAQGKFDEANEKYQKALELGMAKDDVYDKVAKMYFDAKQYKKAAEAYRDKIGKVEPVSTDYFYLGYSLFVTQDYKAADSAFAKVTEVLPEWLPGYVYRAKSNEFLDPELQLLLAKPFHEKVVELGAADMKKNGADLINAYKYLGYVAFKNDMFEEARVNFEKLAEIGEMDVEKFKASLIEAYGNLGYIYFQGKTKADKDKAKEFYNKVLTLDPENEDAKNALQLLNPGK